MAEVCIVGLGPWGLCALERLVDAARRTPTSELKVHVVEPGRPGGGMYSVEQPDYFVLNTPCGQHSMYPFPESLDDDKLGRGFYDWVKQQGYRWEGIECRVSGSGEPVGPHDFLPRRLMGEYLEWFYDVLVSEAPANITVQHLATSAVDLERTIDGRERVHLADGTDLVVDDVVLTTGHMQDLRNMKPLGPMTMSPYPIGAYVGSTQPNEKVAIEGMGLVALDVITALTIGLGGRYATEPDGRLRYQPSGREPSLYVFSRSGYPYSAKSFGAADPMGDYHPAICTIEAVAALKRDADGQPRRMDAREELLPLVFAEIELHYYTCAAHRDDGPGAAREVREDLVDAWAAGTFGKARSKYVSKYGNFTAAEYFFVGAGDDYFDGADYESKVYSTVHADMTEALVASGGSPVKAGLETLRALRDTLRLAIEFQGLTLASYVDFQANLQSRFARLVAGPPAFRSQQLLALMDAGVLKLPFGPSPEVVPAPDGGILVRSTRLEQPFEMVVDRFIRAHLDLPSITRSASPLLANLVRRGRARPLSYDGTPVGSIDLSEDFHPYNLNGDLERRLWVFGVLSEGVRYFTLYIPSPNSRVRAFLDAGVCASEVVGHAVQAEQTEVLRSSKSRPAAAIRVPDGGARAEPPGAMVPRPLRVALVNNMPDGAFEETERQFQQLLQLSADAGGVLVERYTLPGIARSPNIEALIAAGYRGLDHLYRNPPDALVITGAEPKKAELTEELFWPALEPLLWWARDAVPSALVSCLSAHGAVWAFDQLPRRLLIQKCSGVFEQVVDQVHPLMAGVGNVWWPHSRFNEIPAAALSDKGYRVLAQSGEGGWTVAIAERGSCEFLLLQGHPEYGRDTLLREYRRDVRRYLSGNQGSYPRIPTGLLDDEGAEALAAFERELTAKERDPALLQGPPFEVATQHVSAAWDVASRALVGNWLQSARQRSDTPLYSPSAATNTGA